MTEETASVGHRIAKAMFVVVFFWFFWKFGGFLINLLIGRLYGEVALAKDVYTFAYKIVIFAVIYPSLLKVVVPAFMPLFTERLQADEKAAWGFVNTVTNLVLALNVAMLCLGVIFTEKLVHTLAPGFDPATQQATVQTLRVMFPGIFAMNMCVMALVVQNAYKVFSYPSAGDAVQKIMWAIAILAGTKIMGVRVEVIAYGFLFGCVFQVSVNLVGLRSKLHFYRPGFPLLSASRLVKEALIVAGFAACAWLFSAVVIPASSVMLLGMNLDSEFAEFTGWLFLSGVYALQLWWRARDHGSLMARFAALAAPLLLGILFARWRDLTNAFFQSYTKAGWFGNLELAKTIGNLPHIMLGQALAIAMLPYLCELAAKKDWAAFGGVLTSTLRMLALIFIPMTVALCVLDAAIFQLIYDPGNWQEFDLMLGGAGLSFFIWGLVFFAIENALMQSFFSTQKVWWPTLLGIAAAVFHILLMVGVVRWLGFDSPYEIYIATAASLSASRAFKNLLLLVVTRFHVRILPLRSTAVFAVKLLIITLGVWASMHYPLRLTKGLTPLSGLTDHCVQVDTFNFEAKGWFSRDADELQIEHSLAKGDSVDVSGEVVPTRGRSAALAPVTLRVDDSGMVALAEALKAWHVERGVPAIKAQGLLLHQLRNEIARTLRAAGLLAKSVHVNMHTYARGASANRHFLGLGYRMSGRRSLLLFPPIKPRVERDLSPFMLHGIPRFSFRARIDGPGDKSDFALTLEGKAGRQAQTRFSLRHGDGWASIDLKPEDFGRAELGKLRRIAFKDETAVGVDQVASKLLQIDDLAAVTPDQGRIVLDDFEMSGRGWESPGTVQYVPQESAGERALSLAGPRVSARRDLSNYDLTKCDVFSFKVKAERAAALAVTFVGVKGREFAAKPVRVEKSDTRKQYRIRLGSAKAEDGTPVAPAQLVGVSLGFEGQGAPGRLWLDNVEFSATRSAKTRLMFEAFKALRVLIPGFAGFVVFVGLVWALRVEEGRQVFDWLKVHALDRALSKLRRRKTTGPAQAPDDGPNAQGPGDASEQK